MSTKGIKEKSTPKKIVHLGCCKRFNLQLVTRVSGLGLTGKINLNCVHVTFGVAA